MASNLEVSKTTDAARRALGPLSRVREATAGMYGTPVTAPADFDALIQLVKDGVRLMAMTEEDERLAPALAEDFSDFFEPQATDWDVVSNALDWTASFLDAANGRVGDTLANHATSRRASGEYDERAKSLSAAIAGFTQALSVLDERLDVAAMNWNSWTAPSLVNF